MSVPSGNARKRSRLAQTGGYRLAGSNAAPAPYQDSAESAGATSHRSGGSHPGLLAAGPTAHRRHRGVCPAPSALGCGSPLRVNPSGDATCVYSGRFEPQGSPYPPAHFGHATAPSGCSSQNHRRLVGTCLPQHHGSLRPETGSDHRIVRVSSMVGRGSEPRWTGGTGAGRIATLLRITLRHRFVVLSLVGGGEAGRRRDGDGATAGRLSFQRADLSAAVAPGRSSPLRPAVAPSGQPDKTA